MIWQEDTSARIRQLVTDVLAYFRSQSIAPFTLNDAMSASRNGEQRIQQGPEKRLRTLTLQGLTRWRLPPDDGLVAGGVELIQFRDEKRKVLYVALNGDPIAELFKPAFCFSSHNAGLVAAARKPLLQGTHEDADNVSVRDATRLPRSKNQAPAYGRLPGFPGKESLS
jgi:hypothetical protein